MSTSSSSCQGSQPLRHPAPPPRSTISSSRPSTTMQQQPVIYGQAKSSTAPHCAPQPAPTRPPPVSGGSHYSVNPAEARIMLERYVEAQKTLSSQIQGVKSQMQLLGGSGPGQHQAAQLLRAKLNGLQKNAAQNSQAIVSINQMIGSSQQQPPVPQTPAQFNPAQIQQQRGLRHLMLNPERRQAIQQLIKDNAPQFSAPNNQPTTSWNNQPTQPVSLGL